MSDNNAQYADDSNTVSTPMTKEDLLKASDEVLLQMVERAKGHTKEDFQAYMNATFGYTALTDELKRRGYITGWHKKSNSLSSASHISTSTIVMKRNRSKPIRKSYLIDSEIASEWEEFNRDIPYKTVTIGAAFRLFMDAVRAGKINFKLEI